MSRDSDKAGWVCYKTGDTNLEIVLPLFELRALVQKTDINSASGGPDKMENEKKSRDFEGFMPVNVAATSGYRGKL